MTPENLYFLITAAAILTDMLIAFYYALHRNISLELFWLAWAIIVAIRE